MAIAHALMILQLSPLGTAIATRAGLFPSIEIVHVLALAVVFGSILVVDLRLLGISSGDTAVSMVAREVLPYTWAAFAVAAVSGALLFMSNAQAYFDNLQFRSKFRAMAIAGLNMAVFTWASTGMF